MSQISLMPSSAHLILQIDDCFVHKFQNKVRTEIKQGKCQIFQGEETAESEKTYYLKIFGFFHILHEQSVFTRIIYEDCICYLFEGTDKVLYCLSFAKNQEGVDAFDFNFGQFLKIVDFSSELLDPIIRQKIKLHCPDNLETKDISYDPKKTIKKIGNAIGYVTGKTCKIVNNQAMSKALESLSDRANRFQQETISDNAKSKWKSITDATNTINDAMSVIVAPGVSLYNSFADMLGQKFYYSENKIVKSVREYSLVISSSLNQGEKKGQQEIKQAQTDRNAVFFHYR